MTGLVAWTRRTAHVLWLALAVGLTVAFVGIVPATVRKDVLLVVLLLGAVWGARRFALWRRARRAGPIHIMLTNPELCSDSEELTAHLRERLSQEGMTASTPVPGAAGSTEFLEDLRSAQLDVNQPLRVVAEILRLASPRHAWEIRATLLEREASDGHGVAVEVVNLYTRRATLSSIWADSWFRAIELAAHRAMGEILPHTSVCRDTLWVGWRGQQLPGELLDHYRRARTLLGLRRYDEALGAYEAALRLDPFNPSLRNEIAHVQEKLGLFVDALVTYSAILPPLHADAPRFGPAHADRVRVGAQMLASHRFITLLGYDERVASQWLTTVASKSGAARVPVFAPTARDKQRTELRRLLGEFLGDRYTLDPEDEHLWDALGYSGRVSRRDELNLRLLLQICSQQEACALQDRARRVNLAALDIGLTGTSLHLLVVRARRCCELVETAIASLDDGAKGGRRPHPAALVSVAELERTVEAMLGPLSELADHYAAADIYAMELLHDPTPGADGEQRRQQLAVAAVKQLSAAVERASSAVLSGLWDWITSEDPDLARLRHFDAFRDFESRTFPSARLAPRRPSSVHRVEMARYVARLIRHCARRMHVAWHERAELSDAEIHVVLRWWCEELAAWRQMRSLAVNRRDWRSRVDAIVAMQTFAARNGQEPFEIAVPDYAEQPLGSSAPGMNGNDIDALAERLTGDAHELICAFISFLDSDDGAVVTDRAPDGWAALFGALDARGEALDADVRRRLCFARADMWRALDGCFRGDPGDVEASIELLTSAARQLPVPVTRNHVSHTHG